MNHSDCRKIVPKSGGDTYIYICTYIHNIHTRTHIYIHTYIYVYYRYIIPVLYVYYDYNVHYYSFFKHIYFYMYIYIVQISCLHNLYIRMLHSYFFHSDITLHFISSHCYIMLRNLVLYCNVLYIVVLVALFYIIWYSILSRIVLYSIIMLYHICAIRPEENCPNGFVYEAPLRLVPWRSNRRPQGPVLWGWAY
jgi:hypothetical protein